jgi:hypothetical protein
MLNIVIKIVGYIEIGFGIMFLINMASDIQIGFGLVLVFDGANKILR